MEGTWGWLPHRVSALGRRVRGRPLGVSATRRQAAGERMELKKTGESTVNTVNENTKCEARTWREAHYGRGAERGCQRDAVTKVYGRWACKQHAEKPPPHGWMREGRVAS